MAKPDAIARIGLVAKVIHAKRELQRPMPSLERLRTVARINQLRSQLNPGRPAVPFLNPKN